MSLWILVLLIPILLIAAGYYFLEAIFHGVLGVFYAIAAIFEFIFEHIVFFLVAGTIVFLWMKCF